MKLFATALLIFALAFSLPCLAADTAPDAEDLYQQALKIHFAPDEGKPDVKKALSLYMQAAKQGHPGALTYVGGFYDKGLIVKQDYAKAFSSYLQAAEIGDPLAQFNVGVMYLKGDGTDRDYTKAIEWFKKSAENNNAKAAFNLGVMYYTGEGVKANEAEARNWFKTAAKNGNPSAALAIENLGGNMTFYPRDLSDI